MTATTTWLKRPAPEPITREAFDAETAAMLRKQAADDRARAEKDRRRRVRRRLRAARWARRRDAARIVGPLVLITGCAVLGQVLWSLDHIAPVAWIFALRLVLAVSVAAATEAMALTVQWHAHDAEINDRHATAVRLTRISYGIAALVAAVNYSHFADDGIRPTPAAVVFALFSLASPFLWGLHTRRIRDIRRAEEGTVVDLGGAVFLPVRWRIYPVRTFAAWRWSIDRGITDPRRAWVGYHDERAQRRAAHRAARPRTGRRLAEAVITRIERPAPAPTAPAKPASSPLDDRETTAPKPPARVAPAAVTAPAARADTHPAPRPRPRHRPAATDDADRTPGRPPAVSDDELIERAREADDGQMTKSRFRDITRTGGDRWDRLWERYQRENATTTPDSTTNTEETP